MWLSNYTNTGLLKQPLVKHGKHALQRPVTDTSHSASYTLVQVTRSRPCRGSYLVSLWWRWSGSVEAEHAHSLRPRRLPNTHSGPLHSALTTMIMARAKGVSEMVHLVVIPFSSQRQSDVIPEVTPCPWNPCPWGGSWSSWERSAGPTPQVLGRSRMRRQGQAYTTRSLFLSRASLVSWATITVCSRHLGTPGVPPLCTEVFI